MVNQYYKTRSPDMKRAERQRHGRTSKGRYSAMKAKAKQRGVEVTLTLEQYEEAWKPTCSYCAGPVPEIGHGLDRVDNKLGYVEGNVVPCCTTCNKIKGDHLSHEEMKVAMNAVLQYRNGLYAGA